MSLRLTIGATLAVKRCIHCHRRAPFPKAVWCGNCIAAHMKRYGEDRYSTEHPLGEPVDRSPGSSHHYRLFDDRACPCHRPAMRYREAP